MKFKYINAPCGSGKTYQLIEWAVKRTRSGFKVIFVQPTIELIDKTIDSLKRRCSEHGRAAPRCRAFHSGTAAKSVSAELTRYLEKSDIGGEIIFITHQVLPHVRHWPKQCEIVVLIDEVPQVAEHITYNIPHTHSLITQHLSPEPFNSIYSLLVPNDTEELEFIAKNRDKDQIHEQLRRLCQVVTANHRRCFVNTEQYHKLLNGEQSQLSVHSVLQPSVLEGFRSVLIAGANFEDTLLYHIWSAEGVEFAEDRTLKDKLRFQEHQNGSLVTIKYCDERAWSKKGKKTKLVLENQPEPKLIQEMITEVAGAHFDGRGFLWQDNKDVGDNAFGGQGTRLPNIPHGLNDYQNIHNIVFMSALLPRGRSFQILGRNLRDWWRAGPAGDLLLDRLSINHADSPKASKLDFLGGSVSSLTSERAPFFLLVVRGECLKNFVGPIDSKTRDNRVSAISCFHSSPVALFGLSMPSFGISVAPGLYVIALSLCLPPIPLDCFFEWTLHAEPGSTSVGMISSLALVGAQAAPTLGKTFRIFSMDNFLRVAGT